MRPSYDDLVLIYGYGTEDNNGVRELVLRLNPKGYMRPENIHRMELLGKLCNVYVDCLKNNELTSDDYALAKRAIEWVALYEAWDGLRHMALNFLADIYRGTAID